MPELFGNAIVAKRNVLNELRCNSMTVQELRFFSIYLSKINPKDISTRVVRFSIEDFQRIMEFGRLNVKQLQTSTDSLLCKIVHVPDENGRGMRSFQLFKECHIFRDNNEQWYVEIDAHDKALPLMFDFRKNFFQYQLWNALRLRSANQVRMYEVLKQWLNKKSSCTKEFTVAELRELLYISADEYGGRTGWSDFKKYVLDSCQQALKQYTDLCYTYERGKVGRGGKWLTIVFHIEKNTNYDGQTVIEEFTAPALGTMGEDGEFIGQQTLFDMQNDKQDELTDLLGKDFDNADIDYIRQIITDNGCDMSLVRTAHAKYLLYKSKGRIKNPKGDLGYLSKILNQLIADTKKANQQKPSYDLDKRRELAINFDPNTISFDDMEGM